jgi:hypothetical protein
MILVFWTKVIQWTKFTNYISFPHFSNDVICFCLLNEISHWMWIKGEGELAEWILFNSVEQARTELRSEHTRAILQSKFTLIWHWVPNSPFEVVAPNIFSSVKYPECSRELLPVCLRNSTTQ